MSTIHVVPTSRPLIQGWSTEPIPNFSLSAAGLLVLADLSTIAERTALRGGSSWLDSLLLVPGLHYQQAADELSRAQGAAQLTALEIGMDGKPRSHTIVNHAVVNYILRIAKEGRTVVLDVGDLPGKSRSRMLRGRKGAHGQRGVLYSGSSARSRQSTEQGLTWTAQMLYLALPLLTGTAIIIVVLLADWWAFALILALIFSRVLNIIVIKARSKPKPPELPYPFTQPKTRRTPPRITQYTITINPATVVILRGLDTDLYALTTTVWLRPKTFVEGYLEAVAKMVVYVVASVSGNATQAGNLVLLVLLLMSAGLLALSNARITGLQNGGKLVAPSPGQRYTGGGPQTGGDGVHSGRRRALERREESRTETESWPGTSDLSSLSGFDDELEKGRYGRVAKRKYPSDDSVEYEIQLETRVGTLEIGTRGTR